MNKIRFGKYQHFKGKMYEVVGVARHSETLDEFVVYKALYKSAYGTNALWIRPLKMFTEKVTRDGMTFPRFKFLGAKPDRKPKKIRSKN